MRTKYLIYSVIFLIFVTSVSATPFFVSLNSNDEDNVYGLQDKLINLTVVMNKNSYVLYADFSNIETGNNGTQRVINNGDGSYTINYTILSPASNNPVNISIVAFDPSDSTSLTSRFSVIMDNVKPSIILQNKFPFIAFNTDDLILNSTIDDNFGIKKLFITGDWAGSLINYTLITNISNIYSHKVNSSFLKNGQIIKWKYIAVDKANNTEEGNLVISRLNNKTNISLSPSVPDGKNNWYITEPIITLFSDLNTSTIYYKFGNSQFLTYNNPFNRSNNVGNINSIFYFTNFTNKFSNRTESIQNFTLFIDKHKPVIKNINPLNNSIVGNNVNLFALIDEVFIGTSGVNSNTIKLFIDNDSINTNITKFGLNANVSSNINGLTNGIHRISLNAMDIAGNNASLTWFFTSDATNISQINIYSPSNTNYNTNKILINISLSEKVKSLWFLDNSDNKLRLLCNSCKKYDRFLNFADGNHNIKFIGSDNASNNISKDVNFFVDRLKPVIGKINYKNNTITNSSFFDINYNELFLDTVKFYYKEITSSSFNSVTLANCVNGVNKHCNLSLNKNGLDGKTIVYYFEFKDKLNTVLSNKQDISFDFSNPSINLLDPRNSSYNKKNVRFDITSNEKLKSLIYSDNGKRFIPLCSNCNSYNKTLSFSNSTHNVVFKAIDLSENSNTISKTFTINI